MIQIAVCDRNRKDLESTCDRVADFLRKYHLLEYRVDCFDSFDGLLKKSESIGGYDIYIMDTGQKHADGIAAGKEIRKWDKSGAIIYTSATEEFAIHAFRINASQYLLKPLNGFLLDETLSGIVENQNFQNSKRFLIRTKEGTTAVYYHQILFVEYNCHQLFCYLVDGTVISSVYLRISFMLNVKPLLNDSRFLKISTAYVINMDYVQMVTRRGFRMINGRELSVTRTFAGAKTEYMAFIGNTFH